MKITRDEFIIKNLKLVSSRVIKLNNGIFDDDLYQEGTIGLIQAVDRYDESKGFTFSTFAVSYIDGYIKTYKNKDSLIKPKRNKTGRWERKEILSMESTVTGVSGEEELYLCDTLASDEHTEEQMASNAVFDDFLTHLTEDEKSITYLAQSGYNQRDVGKLINLSQAQISRKLKKIKKKYTYYSQLAKA